MKIVIKIGITFFIFFIANLLFADPKPLGRIVPIKVVNNMKDYPLIYIYFSANIEPSKKYCRGERVVVPHGIAFASNKAWVKCEGANPYSPYQCLLRFTVCDSKNNWVTNAVCTGSVDKAGKINSISLKAIQTKQNPVPYLNARAGSMGCV